MGRKVRGHFCWVCGRIRANERFSGSGHTRHVCRECQNLGAAELAVRQTLRNIERMCPGVFIRKKDRARLEDYRTHPEARVRALVEQIFEVDARGRAADREARIADDLAAERCFLELGEEPTVPSVPFDPSDDDIPF